MPDDLPKYDANSNKPPEELIRDIQNARQGIVERLNKAFGTSLDFSPLSLYELGTMVYADKNRILRELKETGREAFATAIGYYLGYVFEDHVHAKWGVGVQKSVSFTHMLAPWGAAIDPLAVSDSFLKRVTHEKIRQNDIQWDYLLRYFYMYYEQTLNKKNDNAAERKSKTLNMSFYVRSRLPNLAILLDSETFPTKQMTVDAATDILNSFYYSALVLNKVGFEYSTELREKVKSIGIVGFPIKSNGKKLFEMVSEAASKQLRVNLDRNKHIIVSVPTNIVGSSTYVIFEKP